MYRHSVHGRGRGSRLLWFSSAHELKSRLIACRNSPISRNAILADLNHGREAEVLLVEILGGDFQSSKLRNGGRASKFAVKNILDRIVRDHVLSETIDGDRHCLILAESLGTSVRTCLFHQPILLEFVAVGQAPDELPLALTIDATSITTTARSWKGAVAEYGVHTCIVLLRGRHALRQRRRGALLRRG